MRSGHCRAEETSPRRAWKLATLGRFMLHLGQMGNLCWLLL